MNKHKASNPDISKQHNSNDFMNFFTYKITIERFFPGVIDPFSKYH